MSCTNGVPFRTERWFIAYTQSAKTLLRARMELVTEKWFRNLRTHFKLGKIRQLNCIQKSPIRASARWSKTIKRMFGRGFLIGFDLRKLLEITHN